MAFPIRPLLLCLGGAAALAGCGGGSDLESGPPPLVAYYDAQGNLVYRGGPLYDADGVRITPTAPGYAPPPAVVSQPVAPPAPQPPAAVQPPAPQPIQPPRPQASQVAAAPPPAPQPAPPQGGYGARFDAQGNLLPLNDGAPEPEFDSRGDLMMAAAPPAAAAPPPAPPPQPQVQPPRPEPQAAPPRPQAPPPQPQAPRRSARISGDPRATAGYDLDGTSWIVQSIGGRPVAGGMTVHFVPVGSEKMAIVDGACGQETGAYAGGRGGAVEISGLNGCDADGGLSGSLSAARRFAVSANAGQLQLIDGNGMPIAMLSSLVSG